MRCALKRRVKWYAVCWNRLTGTGLRKENAFSDLTLPPGGVGFSSNMFRMRWKLQGWSIRRRGVRIWSPFFRIRRRLEMTAKIKCSFFTFHRSHFQHILTREDQNSILGGFRFRFRFSTQLVIYKRTAGLYHFTFHRSRFQHVVAREDQNSILGGFWFRFRFSTQLVLPSPTMFRMRWKLQGRAIRGRGVRIWSPFFRIRRRLEMTAKVKCSFLTFTFPKTTLSDISFSWKHTLFRKDSFGLGFSPMRSYPWRRKGMFDSFGLPFQHNASLAVKAKRQGFRFRVRVTTNAFLAVI